MGCTLGRKKNIGKRYRKREWLLSTTCYEPVHQLESRAISLWGYKTASGCPKFDCNLDLKRRAKEVAHHDVAQES